MNFTEAKLSKRSIQSDLTFFFAALSLAAVLTGQSKSGSDSVSSPLLSGVVPQPVALVEVAPMKEYRCQRFRDPWTNPITSCALIAPQDFGYDQPDIYRLPEASRREWTGPKNGLRDPMTLSLDLESTT